MIIAWEMWPRIFEGAAAICTIACTIVAALNYNMMQATKLAMTQLRLEMTEARAKDAEQRAEARLEMRDWINGSFMRAKEVDAKLNDINNRVDELKVPLEGQAFWEMVQQTAARMEETKRIISTQKEGTV